MDAIVIGCDWRCVVTVDPTSGEANADVTTYLTGATVAAALVDDAGTVISTAAGAVVSAADRTISITFTDTLTTAMAPAKYRWKVRITTSGGLIYPVSLGEQRVLRHAE